MAALLRRVTSFGQLILQFLRCVIFQTEKDKVFELKRKISVADEETFFDICGYQEGEDQSTTVRECGARKGRGQGFPVEKKSSSRKKKSFRKNKISPAEKIAWEECDEKSAKKSHTPFVFTSRSSKASKLQSDFSKSSCRDEHDGKRFKQRSPFPQIEKEKIQDPRQTVDDGCHSLTLNEKESEKPGSLEWHGNESNVKPSSGTVDDTMENSKFPLSLLSKVSFSWKSMFGKSEGETTECCREGPTANDDLREQDFNQRGKSSKERPPHDLHGEQCTGTYNRNDDVDVPKTDRRSKFPLWLKKGKKSKNKGIGELHPGFQNLKKSLDRPNSIRSKILNKWRNISNRKRKEFETENFCEINQVIEGVAASVRESSSVTTEKKTTLESVDSHEPPQSSISRDQKAQHAGITSGSWHKLAFGRKRGRKANKPAIERLHPGFQKLRKTLQSQNSVRSRIVQNVGKVLERMDKELQEIGVAEHQLMVDDIETTHDSSAVSGEQPCVRPLSEMAFRKKAQKSGVERLYPGFQNLKKDLDHPNSVKSKIERHWRHLRERTKTKRSEKEESGVQLKNPVGKDEVNKSPKTVIQQVYPGFENLKKTVEQSNSVRSKIGGEKWSRKLLSRNSKRLERKDSNREN